MVQARAIINVDVNVSPKGTSNLRANLTRNPGKDPDGLVIGDTRMPDLDFFNITIAEGTNPSRHLIIFTRFVTTGRFVVARIDVADLSFAWEV